MINLLAGLSSAADSAWGHQATGVASRAVRWVERSEVRTSGPTRSRDFGEDKVGQGLERRRG